MAGRKDIAQHAPKIYRRYARVQEISLDEINAGATYRRTNVDPEALKELVVSIKAFGVLQPVLVCQVAEHQFSLIAGLRRCIAAEQAGLLTVPAIVLKVHQADVPALTLQENYAREDLNPVDEAVMFCELQREHRLTLSQLAQYIAKSETYARTRLELLTYGEQLIEAVRKGEINLTQAELLSHVEDTRELQGMLELIRESGASTKTIRGWVQEWAITYEKLDEMPKSVLQPIAKSNYQPYRHKCSICNQELELSELKIWEVCVTCAAGIGQALRALDSNVISEPD